jgi:hypothetical protein
VPRTSKMMGPSSSFSLLVRFVPAVDWHCFLATLILTLLAVAVQLNAMKEATGLPRQEGRMWKYHDAPSLSSEK